MPARLLPDHFDVLMPFVPFHLRVFCLAGHYSRLVSFLPRYTLPLGDKFSVVAPVWMLFLKTHLP